MRIVDLREKTEDGWKTIQANVIWERRRRDPQTIYFSTPERDENLLEPRTDPFLTACAIPAALHYERRIEFEDEVCPVLVEGVEYAMQLLYEWWRVAPPIEIEGPRLSEGRAPADNKVAALGFSGGVDSLASLRSNQLNCQPQDVNRFRYAVTLSSGFDAFEIMPGGWYWEQLERVVDDASVRMVSIRSNMRDLEPTDHLFGSHLLGSFLASVGHALGRTVTSYAISSSTPIDGPPEGSHPLLDPLMSGTAVSILSELPAMSRYDKTDLISQWPVVRGNLKVCLVANRLPPGQLNCGKCEKCLRTMLTLLALDRLHLFPEFQPQTITTDRVKATGPLSDAVVIFYADIRDGLARAGYHDLAEVIDEKLSKQAIRPGLSDRFKSFDHERLGGFLKRSYRRIRG